MSNLTYRDLVLTWAECQIWPTGTWYLREQIVKSDLQGLDTDESRITNLTYKELILTWAECQIWPPDVPTWNPPWPWLSVSVCYSSSGNANLLQAPPEFPQLILFLHCHLRSWKNSQTQNFNKTYKLRYLNFFILVTVIIQMNIRTIASNIKLITYNAQFFKNKVRALSIKHNFMV